MKYKCPICKTEQNYKGVCYNCNENFLEYRAYAEKDEWILSKLNYTYFEYGELVKDKKDTYEKVKKHYENLEKHRRYTKGEVILTFDELLKQKIVWLGGSPKPISFILSMQLNTVKNMLGRQVYYCVEKKSGQSINEYE